MIAPLIAFRNIFRHKTRSLITLSTIVFGCVALIFAGGFFEDVYFKMRESYIKSYTGHIQIFKKGFLEHGRTQPYNFLIDDYEKICREVESIKTVKFITPRFEFSGLVSTGENTISFMGMGVETKNEKANNEITNNLRQSSNNLTVGGVVMLSGEQFKESETYSITLGKGLAQAIGAKTGDGLVLLTNTVNGSVNALDVNVKGIFYTSSKAFDDHFMRMNLKTSQKLLGTNAVQSLVVMLNDTSNTKITLNLLKQKFSSQGFDLELRSWEEVSDFYNQTVTLFNRLFLILKIVITIIVILSIFNTMNMAVFERISEIGTIMALGTKQSGVISLFMYEGLFLGILGGTIGLFAGGIVTTIISSIGIPMPPPPGATMMWLSEPKLIPSMFVFSFTLSVLTSIISTVYPAYTASRLEIADALRNK